MNEALCFRVLFALVPGDLQFQEFQLEIVQQSHLIGFHMSKQPADLQGAGDTNEPC